MTTISSPFFTKKSEYILEILSYSPIVTSDNPHSIHCPLGCQTFPEDPGDGGGRKQPGICIDRYVLES
jgi:hypothetical protein